MALVAAVTYLLALACAQPTQQTAAETARVLRVGTSGDYPPFSLRGEGFDIDVIERFAEHSGYEIVWHDFDWPQLSDAVQSSQFDVAVGGITWRPFRAVTGTMTRALAIGGPCVVGAEEPTSIAVNEGGILERWARSEFGESADILAVDDNESLPLRLSRSEVDAFVTDSFEVSHFAGDVPYDCEPAVDRKVYWVTSEGGSELALQLDAWLAVEESWIDGQRQRHFGHSQPRGELDHLLDLIGRRLELMPAVGAWKRDRDVPIEDLERERVVLDAVARDAERLGVDSQAARRLFTLLIDLAKRIQARSSSAPSLQLDEIRPVLLTLGTRILEAFRDVPPIVARDLGAERTEHLGQLLEKSEIDELTTLLIEVTSTDTPPESP